MNDNQFAYIKEQIEFLKSELNREVPTNQNSQFQPDTEQIELGRNQIRDKILALMERLGNPQWEERREQEKQYYRSLLEKLSADGTALKTAVDVAGQCDDDDVRRAIYTDAAMAYEGTKAAIAKAILEKLA